MKAVRASMLRNLLITFMAFAMTTNLSFAAGGRLIEIFFDKAFLKSSLESKTLFNPDQVSKAAGFVDKSLRALGAPDKKLTKSDLEKLLNDLKGDIEEGDKSYIETIEKRLLVKESDKKDFTDDELLEVIDSLTYLATRYGKNGSFVSACSRCVFGSFPGDKLKHALVEIKNGNIKDILESFNNLTPTQLRNKVIDPLMKKYGLGELPSNAKNLPPQQEKNLALFLTLLEEGTSTQKRYAQAALDMAQEGNQLNLFNNKFWMRFANDMSEEEMLGLAELMEAAAKKVDNSTSDISMKKAFNEVLISRAEKSGNKLTLEETNNINKIQEYQCFFK